MTPRGKRSAVKHSIAKFDMDTPFFGCPFCSENLDFSSSSLRCANGHTFDISRKGYVDLRRRAMASAHYTEAFFEARLRMMHRGMYADLVAVLRDVLERFAPRSGGARLDVGCGDGFITRALELECGLDISLDAIKVAARGGGETLWACGDGAHLPLVDASVAAILNVFAPSEYAEFSRIAPGGVLVKVIPGEKHMWQLRKAVGLASETHSSAPAIFAQQVRELTVLDVEQTTDLPSEKERHDVALMSPVGFDRLEASNSWKDVENITTHSRVLVGRLP